MSKNKRKSEAAMTATETKLQRFARVVTPRVTKALKAVRLIGNCSGPAYEHTDEQLTKIFEALDRTVGNMKATFAEKDKAQDKFDLNM